MIVEGEVQFYMYWTPEKPRPDKAPYEPRLCFAHAVICAGNGFPVWTAIVDRSQSSCDICPDWRGDAGMALPT